MGREAKRAKQARRDRRKRDGSGEMPSVTVRALRTEAEVRAAMETLFPTAKTGDWRPDVLGQESLSMQPDSGGRPLLNGHLVTREMCDVLQAERPEVAGDFVYDDIVALAKSMGAPDLGSEFGAFLETSGTGCSGAQLDHMDGSMSCSRGTACAGVALPHRTWMDCGKHGPCEFCAGPPVIWTH
jgi:hypothetical protein